jgi:PAS domain-containing protein
MCRFRHSMTIVLVAIACLLVGIGAGAMLAARRIGSIRVTRSARSPLPAEVADDRLRLAFATDTASCVEHVASIAASRFGIHIVAVYAGRDGAGGMGRVGALGAGDLPEEIADALHTQLAGPQVVMENELSRGLFRLPGGGEDKEHQAQPSENPFHIDDEPAPTVESEPSQPAPRYVALPWNGPFGWTGLLVARHRVGDHDGVVSQYERFAQTAGERLAVALELDACREQQAVTPTASAPLPQLVGDLLLERRVAAMLQAPRTEADAERAALGLLAEGLHAGRAFAVRMEGLRPQPVELEIRRGTGESIAGAEFGDTFFAEVFHRSQGIARAVIWDRQELAGLVPAETLARLSGESLLTVPSIDGQRVIAVYVVERPDGNWTSGEREFAEHVAARATIAIAQSRLRESLAEEAGHARVAQQQVADALDQLQAVLSSLPQAVLGLDDGGAVVFANRTAGRLLGRHEFDIIGRGFDALASDCGFEPADAEKVLAATEAQCIEAKRRGQRCELRVAPAGEASRLRLVVFSD